MDYADPEVALSKWANATFDARAVTELPADLASALPLIDIDHIGGADDQPTLADLTIDFGFYAATKGAASALARQVHHALRFDLPGQILTAGSTGSVTILGVRPSFLPRPDPTYDFPGVYRYLASYGIGFKTRRAA